MEPRPFPQRKPNPIISCAECYKGKRKCSAVDKKTEVSHEVVPKVLYPCDRCFSLSIECTGPPALEVGGEAGAAGKRAPLEGEGVRIAKKGKMRESAAGPASKVPISIREQHAIRMKDCAGNLAQIRSKAPLFEAVFARSYDYYFVQDDNLSEIAPYPGILHGTVALGRLFQGDVKGSELEAEAAQKVINQTMKEGRASEAANMVLSLTLLLYRSLLSGVWLQNCNLANQAIGLCNAAWLFLEPQGESFQYGTGSRYEGQRYIQNGRLFWLVYILYIQMVSCSPALSASATPVENITLALPTEQGAKGGGHLQAGSNTYTDHNGYGWFGMYAKAAILLGRTQEVVRWTLSTERKESPAVLADLKRDLENFQRSYNPPADGDTSNYRVLGQIMPIRAMIAACHILLHDARSHFHESLDELAGLRREACLEVATGAEQVVNAGGGLFIEPFVIHSWMLVYRALLQEIPSDIAVCGNMCTARDHCLHALRITSQTVEAARVTLKLLNIFVPPIGKTTEEPAEEVEEIMAKFSALKLGAKKPAAGSPIGEVHNVHGPSGRGGDENFDGFDASETLFGPLQPGESNSPQASSVDWNLIGGFPEHVVANIASYDDLFIDTDTE